MRQPGLLVEQREHGLVSAVALKGRSHSARASICSMGITSKLHVVYHIHGLSQAVLFQSARIKRSLCLLMKQKAQTSYKTEKVIFFFLFIKSSVCACGNAT